LPQPRIASDRKQMAHESRRYSLALIGIDNDERQLGLARLRDDVTSSTGDHWAAVFELRNQRNVIGEIDIHEKRNLLVREPAVRDEETALQRLHAGAVDRCEHVVPIVRP